MQVSVPGSRGLRRPYHWMYLCLLLKILATYGELATQGRLATNSFFFLSLLIFDPRGTMMSHPEARVGFRARHVNLAT
ncbi:hypothetical protein BGX38DRAFT_1194281 [Terfezia claveryi]|nr:hypothetical protein BGX38DRAFT_1194281 [Terfezia claveryi]